MNLSEQNFMQRVIDAGTMECMREYYPRRIGASLIGNQCLRAIWYTYRHASPTRRVPLLDRITELGKWMEEDTIHRIRAAGSCEVWDTDPQKGEGQIEYSKKG